MFTDKEQAHIVRQQLALVVVKLGSGVFVVCRAERHQHQVGVLFDTARFAQVVQLRLLVGAAFRSAVQLAQ